MDTYCCRYRLSSGADGSSSEDERYDVREAMIFRKATASEGASGRDVDAGGQRSEEDGGRSGVDVTKGDGPTGNPEGVSAVVGVAMDDEGPMGSHSPGVGVAKAKESDISMRVQSSGVGVTEDDLYGASTDEEGAEEMDVPVEGQSPGVGVTVVEDPYGVSTDEEEGSDDEGTEHDDVITAFLRYEEIGLASLQGDTADTSLHFLL